MGEAFKLTRRADGTDWTELEPGEFAYRNPPRSGLIKWFSFWPPDSSAPLMIPIYPEHGENGATWRLSGRLDAPTISPSVNAKGVWHGYVTEGFSKHV